MNAPEFTYSRTHISMSPPPPQSGTSQQQAIGVHPLYKNPGYGLALHSRLLVEVLSKQVMVLSIHIWVYKKVLLYCTKAGINVACPFSQYAPGMNYVYTHRWRNKLKQVIVTGS